jgi:hypothetical protein
MGLLDKEIAVYMEHRERLEAEHPLEWAVVYNGELIGVYDTVDEAAQANMERVLAGECLIRHIVPSLSYFLPDWKELGFVNGNI